MDVTAGRLDGAVAVVTGAGQGIGRAAAQAFAREGAEVWAVDRNDAALAEVTSGARLIRSHTLDVTDRAGVAAFASAAGRVDVLFNCAGVVPMGSVLGCTEGDWSTAFEVNVTSMFLMIRALAPAMLAAGRGSIINMSSVVSSIAGAPNRFAYGASKAAVIGLTKSVAADFVTRGVRCNAIAPGTVDTPSLHDRVAAAGDADRAMAGFVARQPMGRLGTPEEIAALAVYLASEESAYATGAVFVVDGGMSL
jgi:2-keto-3-deoxy-L-fuconate dehydrogenase